MKRVRARCQAAQPGSGREWNKPFHSEGNDSGPAPLQLPQGHTPPTPASACWEPSCRLFPGAGSSGCHTALATHTVKSFAGHPVGTG